MRPLTYCHSEIRKQRPAFQSGPQGTDTPSRPKVTTCETFHSDGERLEGYVTSYKGHLVSKCKSPLDARTARLVEPHPTTGGPQGGTGSKGPKGSGEGHRRAWLATSGTSAFQCCLTNSALQVCCRKGSQRMWHGVGARPGSHRPGP